MSKENGTKEPSTRYRGIPDIRTNRYGKQLNPDQARLPIFTGTPLASTNAAPAVTPTCRESDASVDTSACRSRYGEQGSVSIGERRPTRTPGTPDTHSSRRSLGGIKSSGMRGGARRRPGQTQMPNTIHTGVTITPSPREVSSFTFGGTDMKISSASRRRLQNSGQKMKDNSALIDISPVSAILNTLSLNDDKRVRLSSGARRKKIPSKR